LKLSVVRSIVWIIAANAREASAVVGVIPIALFVEPSVPPLIVIVIARGMIINMRGETVAVVALAM